jgi:hypothetical protein
LYRGILRVGQGILVEVVVGVGVVFLFFGLGYSSIA